MTEEQQKEQPKELEKRIKEIAQDKIDADIDIEAMNKEIEKEKSQFKGRETSIDTYSKVMSDIATSYDEKLYVSIINQYTKKALKKLDTKKWYWCIAPYLLLYGSLVQGFNEIEGDENLEIDDFEFSIKDEKQKPASWFVDAYNMASKIFLWIINKEKGKINKEFDSSEVTPAIQWKNNTIDHMVYSWVLYWWKPKEWGKEWVEWLIDNFSNIIIE